mgnify:CR=1 FL=1
MDTVKLKIAAAALGVGVVCAATGYLAGASGEAGSTAKSQMPVASTASRSSSLKRPALDSSSPDNFIKSWWAYMDYNNAKRAALCLESAQGAKSVERRRLAREFVRQAVTPAVEARFPTDQELAADCTLDTVAREISSVKVETETRAIVYATLHNTTPAPADIVATAFDLEMRKTGVDMKYVLEKADGKWRLAQVYVPGLSYREPKDDPKWRAQLEPILPSADIYVREVSLIEVTGRHH